MTKLEAKAFGRSMKKMALADRAFENALAEAIKVGGSIAEEVMQLTGGRGFKSAMAEMIPDRMSLWNKLSPTDKKRVMEYIKRRAWG
jgi:hypothetical protein